MVEHTTHASKSAPLMRAAGLTLLALSLNAPSNVANLLRDQPVKEKTVNGLNQEDKDARKQVLLELHSKLDIAPTKALQQLEINLNNSYKATGLYGVEGINKQLEGQNKLLVYDDKMIDKLNYDMDKLKKLYFKLMGIALSFTFAAGHALKIYRKS